MTRNLTFISTDRIFNVSWLDLNQLEKYVSVSCDGVSNPLGKKALYLPPSPSEIGPFHTPLPFGISVTLPGGGYGYFLEPHIKLKSGTFITARFCVNTLFA